MSFDKFQFLFCIHVHGYPFTLRQDILINFCVNGSVNLYIKETTLDVSEGKAWYRADQLAIMYE
jgi:hypothetical protein